MIRRWSRQAVCGVWAAVLIVGCSGSVTAQSATTGVVTGTVRDASGDPLTSALVTLQERGTGLTRMAYTDLDGRFRFGLLPVGAYELAVEKLAYGPKRITDIPVRPGLELRVEAELVALRPAQAQVDVERLEGAALRGSRPGGTEWVPGWAVRMLPYAGRAASETVRLTSRAGADLSIEGLPPWLTALTFDGTMFRPAAHPLVRSAAVQRTSFGLGGVASSELVTNGIDVEWGGAAGGWLSMHSRQGSPSLEFEGRGAWAGSVLPGPSFGNGLSYNDAQGAVMLRTPLLGDSARLSAGIELHRLETPVSRLWGDSPAAVSLGELGDSFGLDLAANRRAAVAETQAFAGFLRFDWHAVSRHRAAAWLQLASQPRLMGAEPRLGTLQAVEGADLVGGGSVVSEFGSNILNEVRLSVTSSTRSTADLSAVGPTWVVSDGLTLGGLRTAARGEETRVTLSNVIHFNTGRHALKAGGGAVFLTQRYDHRTGSEGEVYFGELNDVLGRRGLLVRTAGAAPAANWSTTAPFVFAQNRWNAGDGLDVQIGARTGYTPLPRDAVSRDAEWERLSGLASDSIGKTRWQRELRAGLTWDVQQARRWILHAGGGIFTDEVDPLLLNEWLTDAGTGRVHREIGPLNWPTDATTGGSFRRITMLNPGFAAPQTVRGGAGVSHRVGNATAIHLSGAIRRTENLPRRTDLNLQQVPSFRDQYARPIFGELVQMGALLAAQPGSGRRFPTYDEAAGINADGWSDYVGVTVGVDSEPEQGPAFLVRYTFSRTEDNWFGARDGGWTVSPPLGLDGSREWAEGISDFDTPHRLAAGATVPLPFGLRIGAVYRAESGVPFTPGFRRGVDASGDGSMNNDPAFVDPAFPGMNEMLSLQSCLSESRGRFAARNSCRGDAVHSLDLSVGVDFLRLGNRTASLTADIFDVFESAGALPDAALFLVDPAGTLDVDAGARTVSVPLLLNPSFGTVLVRPHAGRKLRLGFSVKW
ncbi:hypothetical protein BH23GEM9_BH23GEM9_31790 [soil metagenome]